MSSATRSVGYAGIFLGLLVAGDALADDGAANSSAPVQVDARKEAARKFEEGTRAFDVGDFTRAGEAFEAAYLLAPHEDPLWNAARAWQKAGETARAANLYARYLREAPTTAKDRANATTALAGLSTKLARLEIHLASGADRPDVDGVAAGGPVVFVVPGAHIVRAHTSDGMVESRQVVSAGARVSVLLAPAVAEPPPEATPIVSPASPATTTPTPPAKSSGWSPLVVVVEGGVTLVVTGLAVWSGLDTLSTLHTYNSTPSQDGLESGRSQEVRTNILIGAAIGCAAVTAITALWLTDWRKHEPSVGFGIGPGTGAIYGRF